MYSTMYDIAVKYTALGWHITINQHSQLIIEEVRGGNFFALNGVIGRERTPIEGLISRQPKPRNFVRRRFTH